MKHYFNKSFLNALVTMVDCCEIVVD